MDWTIVVSVLVALLLWPIVLGSVIALVGLTAAAVFRGRFQGLMEQKMAHCKDMFSSHGVAPAAGHAVGSCCGTETPERT